MRFVATLALAITAVSAVPAVAQERAVRLAHDAIGNGDFASAERRLIAEQRIYPNNSEVMLNLAAVYAGTGRQAQAASLYRQVLAQRDVLMDLDAERSQSAHAIAQTGLERLDIQMTAAR